MIPALGIRLNKHDAKCDKHAIYMDSTAIAIRPDGLSDPDWEKVCRFLCGYAPVEDWLSFPDPPADDPAAWTRMEAYLRPYEHSRGSNGERLALERSSKRGRK